MNVWVLPPPPEFVKLEKQTKLLTNACQRGIDAVRQLSNPFLQLDTKPVKVKRKPKK